MLVNLKLPLVVECDVFDTTPVLEALNKKLRVKAINIEKYLSQKQIDYYALVNDFCLIYLSSKKPSKTDTRKLLLEYLGVED